MYDTMRVRVFCMIGNCFEYIYIYIYFLFLFATTRPALDTPVAIYNMTSGG
jgi:hypothetical protein